MTARSLPIALVFSSALVMALAGADLASAQEAPIARSYADSAPPVAPATPATPPTSTAKPIAVAEIAPQTAANAPGVRASGDPTGDQIADWLRSDNAPVQPLDPRDQPFEDQLAPRQIHGEVEVGVSNRGYEGRAAASMPLGQASELDVAVGAAHVRTPWGNANPKSLSVGLFLDGGDVARWISRDKCHVPRYGVSLPTDPQLQADGSCIRPDKGDARNDTRNGD